MPWGGGAHRPAALAEVGGMRGVCRAGGAKVSRAGGEGGSASLHPRPFRWLWHMTAGGTAPRAVQGACAARAAAVTETHSHIVTGTQTQAQTDTGTAVRAAHAPRAGEAQGKLLPLPPSVALNCAGIHGLHQKRAGRRDRPQECSRDARDPRGMCSAMPGSNFQLTPS